MTLATNSTSTTTTSADEHDQLILRDLPQPSSHPLATPHDHGLPQTQGAQIQPQVQNQAQVADAPPAYTPHTLPPYTHFDPEADARNYAISLLMHNLHFNSDSDSDPSEPRFPALQLPSSPTFRQPQRQLQGGEQGQRQRQGQGQGQGQDRIQRAAIRDFQDTQDPAQWGTRSPRLGTGTRATVRHQGRDGDRGGGGGGVWSWIFDLFVVDLDNEQDDRTRYHAGIPFWVTQNGAN